MHPVAEDILTFWFGTTDLAADIERREVWFRSTPEFDAALRERYTGVQERAGGGAFDRFVDTREDCLALVLALDQFPRNIFRGTPRAFATDAKAREVARTALDRRYDRGLCRSARVFFYLPFEHSESLADQERAVELYRGLEEERSLRAALGHRDAIRRFGRFPHRNAVLGRENTPDEAEYLKDPPLWGKTAAEVAEIERRKARGEMPSSPGPRPAAEAPDRERP